MNISQFVTRCLGVMAVGAALMSPDSFAAPSTSAPGKDPATPTPATPVPSTPPIKTGPAPTTGGTAPASPQNGPGGAAGTPSTGQLPTGWLGAGSGGAAGSTSASGGAAAGTQVAGSGTADKGARDPARFSRPPNTVRILYSMDEYPPTTQEEVKYTSSSSSADLLAFYTKDLTGQRWTMTELHENNGGPNDVHQIYGHWTNQSNDALDLRLIDSKPGVVEITVDLKRLPYHDPRT